MELIVEVVRMLESPDKLDEIDGILGPNLIDEASFCCLENEIRNSWELPSEAINQ
jgi:hypothetical protein